MNLTIATLLYKLYNANYRVVISEIDPHAFYPPAAEAGYIINVERMGFAGSVDITHQFPLALDASDEDFRRELLNIADVFDSEIEDAEAP